MLIRSILLVIITLLTACGEPLTDEMVKNVAETCKQHNMILRVDNLNKVAKCEKEN